jgi:hypothetical protein
MFAFEFVCSLFVCIGLGLFLACSVLSFIVSRCIYIPSMAKIWRGTE